MQQADHDTNNESMQLPFSNHHHHQKDGYPIIKIALIIMSFVPSMVLAIHG